MKFFAGFATFLFILSSCKNASPVNRSDNTSDTTHFYPVTEYLKQQIQQVDNTPFFLYKISIKNGRKDSSVINQKTFDSLAHEFIEEDITTDPLKKFYTENIFEDVSTDSYTITYSTTDSKLDIQNVDVLLSRDDEKVKWIFMNKAQTIDSTTVFKKMGWQPDRRFYINQVVTDKDGKEHEEENTVVWNDKD